MYRHREDGKNDAVEIVYTDTLTQTCSSTAQGGGEEPAGPADMFRLTGARKLQQPERMKPCVALTGERYPVLGAGSG